MGSDDTSVTDSVPAVQEPESASAAKKTPSDGSGEADGGGASRPLSHRHQQERVQNFKDECEVMDVPMGHDDNLLDEKKLREKVPESASVAPMMSGRAAPKPSDSSCGGDGSGAPYPWSLTEEEHMRNLVKNWEHAFGRFNSRFLYGVRPSFQVNDPYLKSLVAKLRDDPFENNNPIDLESRAPPHFLEGLRPLHLAVLMGDPEMVQKILEIRLEPKEFHIDARMGFYSALDLAIVGGESEIVDALLAKNAKVNAGPIGSLHWAVYYAWRTDNTCRIIQSLVCNGIDLKAKNDTGYSAFYLAVVLEKTDIVNELLKCKDKIHLNGKCGGGRPPIQIAHEEGYKDIESALMQCDDVRRFIEAAFRDRQAYVDAANAILVGAALIASVTFASWLQPPLNYTTPYHVGSSVEYVDVEHNFALGLFWVFDTLSFYFAMGTVVCAAHSVLPRSRLFITENVKKLSQNLFWTSIFLAFSVLFVMIAFGIAGFIVLIPLLRYRWYMIAPTILGGIACVVSIGYLSKSLWENRPWKIRSRKRNRSELLRFSLLFEELD